MFTWLFEDKILNYKYTAKIEYNFRYCNKKGNRIRFPFLLQNEETVH